MRWPLLRYTFDIIFSHYACNGNNQSSWYITQNFDLSEKRSSPRLSREICKKSFTHPLNKFLRTPLIAVIQLKRRLSVTNVENKLFLQWAIKAILKINKKHYRASLLYPPSDIVRIALISHIVTGKITTYDKFLRPYSQRALSTRYFISTALDKLYLSSDIVHIALIIIITIVIHSLKCTNNKNSNAFVQITILITIIAIYLFKCITEQLLLSENDAISSSKFGKRRKLQKLHQNMLGMHVIDIAVNWLFLLKTTVHTTVIFVNV